MVTNWLEIDGIRFNVCVTEIEESAEVLYSENTGRTMSVGARVTLDPLGTFYNHKVTVSRRGEYVNDYDTLFTYVTQPTSKGFHIKAVHNQSTIEYDCYISVSTRKLKKIDEKKGKVYWDEMSLSIVALEAQVKPV